MSGKFWLELFLLVGALFAFLCSGNLAAGEPSFGFLTLDIPLVSDPEFGRHNLIGFPLQEPVPWSEVRVIYGGRVLSLDDSDPLSGGTPVCQQTPISSRCTMSRVMHQWTGSAWQAFNGTTPGMEGTLLAFDAFVVTAMAHGISLRIPLVPETDPSGTGARRNHGWNVRLVARSGSMEDRGNLIGQIPGAATGHDMHDVEELPPLGDNFLSIVFENDRFPDSEWGFTSDFRSPTNRPYGEWPFVVRASDEVSEITLSWEGNPLALYSGWLIDLHTGEWIRPFPGTSYSYRAGPEDREFIFALYNR